MNMPPLTPPISLQKIAELRESTATTRLLAMKVHNECAHDLGMALATRMAQDLVNQSSILLTELDRLRQHYETIFVKASK